MKISQLNVVSLIKQKVEVTELMHEHHLDIPGINECRLSKDICDSEVTFEGYDIYRQYRDTSEGGVAIYVKDTIPHHYNQNNNRPLLNKQTKFYLRMWRLKNSHDRSLHDSMYEKT